MAADAITLVGLLITLGVFASYLSMLFVLHRFTYKTWVFDLAVIAGIVLGLIGLGLGGRLLLTGLVLAFGAAWFVASRRERAIRGSHSLRVRVGDPMPGFNAVSTDGRVFTQKQLTDAAPALLILYRGWWCPSSKLQLDDMLVHYRQLSDLGLTLFAGSVDSPEESAPMQEHVGSKITILGDVDVAFLDAIGVRDQRGAPWYDRLLIGAKTQPIAMPAAIAVGPNGRITFAERSTRVDDRPRPTSLIESLTPATPAPAAG